MLSLGQRQACRTRCLSMRSQLHSIAMNKTLLTLGLISGFISFAAHADIYKQVDANGHVTYSNVPIKGAVKLNLDPVDSGGSAEKSGRGKTATPANFPRVDHETQNQRDDKRKQILQEELSNENKALEDAKKAYAEGESKPEVYRGANGKTFRNVPKYDEKMKRLQEDVTQHEKNVQLLQKELDGLK